ncbi:hypothetical protein BKA62DRAFT_716899, partial [Auriculariales sp. MPI-PUGE-AT-0066]
MHLQAGESAHYAPTQLAPLIKNPAVRVPKPAVMPPDIHPLPDNISDYMVYPFALEQHVATIESARRATVASHAARRQAYLKSREQEKERHKREVLRRVAPGFNPDAPLTPTRATPAKATSPTAVAATDPGHARTRSVMDDLVDHLAALEARDTGPLSPPAAPPR